MDTSAQPAGEPIVDGLQSQPTAASAAAEPAAAAAGPLGVKAFTCSLAMCSQSLLNTDSAGSFIDREGTRPGSIWHIVAAVEVGKSGRSSIYQIGNLDAPPAQGRSLMVALYSVDAAAADTDASRFLFLTNKTTRWMGRDYDIPSADGRTAAQAHADHLRLGPSHVWRLYRVPGSNTAVHLTNLASEKLLRCNFGTKVTNQLRQAAGWEPMPRLDVEAGDYSRYTQMRMVPPGTKGTTFYQKGLDTVNGVGGDPGNPTQDTVFDRMLTGAIAGVSSLFSWGGPPAPAAAPAAAAGAGGGREGVGSAWPPGADGHSSATSAATGGTAEGRAAAVAASGADGGGALGGTASAAACGSGTIEGAGATGGSSGGSGGSGCDGGAGRLASSVAGAGGSAGPAEQGDQESDGESDVSASSTEWWQILGNNDDSRTSFL